MKTTKKKAEPAKLMKVDDDEAIKLTYSHLWNNFMLTAQQRVQLFQYYITFFALFMAVFGYLYVDLLKDLNRHDCKTSTVELVAIATSAILCFITVVFYNIEQRNRMLVKNARQGLMEFEEHYMPHEKYRIYNKDKNERERAIRHSSLYKAIFAVGFLTSCSIFLYMVYNVLKCHLS